MSTKLQIRGNSFVMTDLDSGNTKRFPKERVRTEDENNTIYFYYADYEKQVIIHDFSDLVDDDENPFESMPALMDWLDTNLGSATTGGVMETLNQDATNPLLIVKMSKLIAETTLTAATIKEDRIISVADTTGFAVGLYCTIYNAESNRVYFANVLSINALDITMDTPLDFEFAIGSFVSIGSTNLAVDGSVTPQIFGTRNPTGVDIPLSFDCTRVTFKCLTDTSVDLSKFGDIASGLTKGLIMRRVDGIFRNIFNVKTNGDLKNITFDFDIQTLTGQGQDVFTARLTFTRLGAVSRLITTEDLQVIVQDDLSTLDNFEIIAQGHVVTNEIKPL